LRLSFNNTLLITILILILSSPVYNQIINGADLLFSENLDLITGKKIAVVCNHTALLANGTHLVDALLNQKDVEVKAIFTPEHGFKGSAEAGETVDYKNNTYKNVPIISIYGKSRKPTKENLKDIDLLIFDIQDVGARFYTYISTLYYTLEAAGENNIPALVLDRPNPIGGKYVDGPVLENKFKSFVGIAPIPIAHGMTVGELAKYFVGEKLIPGSENISFNVIKCKNWKREIPEQFFDKWINPSPNINSVYTALVYPGTCLLEGTNISEGRGTTLPFIHIGAPFINSVDLINELNKMPSTGIELKADSFTPEDIPEMSTNPKYKNELCNGLMIKVIDPNSFESVKFGVKLLSALLKLYPDKMKFKDSSFDRLAGTSVLREQLLKNTDPVEIFNSWDNGLDNFKKIRKQYLLY
jgi:uncharacterized protein YbbC (DUF1343 family)